MNATRKVKLKDIKSNLTCKLCLGYLVDATTIIECLHSFCKSCIISYLEKSDREEKYCPVCDVQLHSTKPLTSIRSDLMLQEIVYKLVPGLFKDEMRRRREFYVQNDDATPSNPLDSGQVYDELYITSDDVLHLSMEYMTDDEKLKESTRRYLKCPAAVSIFVLKKLLQGKYDLDADTNIDIMFGDRMLPEDFLLMDIAYKYSWTKSGNKPLNLRYRIRGDKKPSIKLERTINDTVPTSQPIQPAVQEELLTPPISKKKVCNENGSNIMPSEDIKPSQIKTPTNGLIPRVVTIPPIKTPNGKIRGRKRKHLVLPPSEIVVDKKDGTKNPAKRSKLEKAGLKNILKKSQSESSFNAQTQVKIIPTNNNNESNDSIGHGKDVKEVQLQISENGVMSARSVSCNGDDKIVYDLSKRASCKPSPSTASNCGTSPNSAYDLNLTEKLLLSGNFHSKTGPSGVTEIICDKPDPISSAMKTTSAKPGYVTLNIPTPKNPMASQNGRFQNTNTSNGNAADKKKLMSGQNGSPSSGTNYNAKDSSTNKSSVLEKIKNKLAAKGGEADSNVLKTIADLGKLCSNGGTTIELANPVEPQRTAGMHSLPIIAPMSSQFQQQLQKAKPSNGPGKSTTGTDTFTLPLALNFSPASGMSVSMIPCSIGATANGNSVSGTANNGSNISLQTTTPPKRAPHHTSLVNGDLKFRTSPKPILPKLNADHDASSNKKPPPKFFKSRRMSLSGTSQSSTPNRPNASASPKNDSSNELKRKTPTSMITGNGTNSTSEPLHKKSVKERKEQTNKESSSSSASPIDFMKLLNLNPGLLAAASALQQSSTGNYNISISSSNDISNGNNGIHVSRPLTHPSQTNDKYSQHLTALSSLAAVNSTDALTSGLGIAAVAAAHAAASNVNGLPVGMVPFVTNNYCSLPILNQKHPMTQYTYGYNFPGVGYSIPLGGSTTNLTTATTTPVNSSKPKSVNAIPSPGSNKSRILNGLLSTTTSTSDVSRDSGSTLDLTVSRNTTNETVSSSQEKASDANPVLVSLLASKPISPTPKSHINNGSSNTFKSEQKAKSPLMRQLLAKSDGKTHAASPTAKELYNGINGNVKDEVNKGTPRNDKGEGTVIGALNKNGTGEKFQSNSTSKSEEKANHENTSSNNNQATQVKPKSSLASTTNSPKMSNDSDSNNSSTSSSTSTNAKKILDNEQLLCFSAQNNNIDTMSNNHDKSIDITTKNKMSDNLDCSSIAKSNDKSDSNIPSTGAEQLSS